MDRITQSLLDEFSREHDISGLPQNQRFEHFVSYVTVRRQYSETFDTEEIVTGAGGDIGIDAIAIIVNGNLVTDRDSLNEMITDSDHLDVMFIFVQASRSIGFEAAKIGSFSFGVLDFFSSQPRLPRNDEVKEAASIMSAIYEHSGKFKRGNPSCRLYYVTTGKWTTEAALRGDKEPPKTIFVQPIFSAMLNLLALVQTAFKDSIVKQKMRLPVHLHLPTGPLHQRSRV